VPPTNVLWSVFSPSVSYFNGTHEESPTNTVWSLFSPSVTYFNGVAEPGPANAFIISPIVSYENQ
jgi:hypothetical protein